VGRFFGRAAQFSVTPRLLGGRSMNRKNSLCPVLRIG
jgi:hypothetical protein